MPERPAALESVRGRIGRVLPEVPAIALATMAAQLLFLHFAWRDPVYRRLPIDAQDYLAIARSIERGNMLGGIPFRHPLYPYLLAAISWLTGTSDVRAVQLAQAVAGCGSVLLVRRIGMDVYSRAAGNAGAVLLAGYWSFAFHNGEILGESFFLFFLLLFFFLSLSWRRSGATVFRFLAAGLALSVAVMIRPTAVLLLPLVLVFLCWKPEWPLRRLAIRIALFLGAFASLVAVNMARNRILVGKPLAFSATGGLVFYMGNHPGANGYDSFLPGIRTALTYPGLRAYTENLAGRPLDFTDVMGYWSDRSMELVRTHPGAVASAIGRKTLLLLNRFEMSDNREMYQFRRENPALRVYPFNFAVILAAFVLGWTAVPGNRRDFRYLVATAFLLSMGAVLFLACSRFRLPVVPFLCVTGGAGIVELGHRLVREKSYRKLALPAVFLMVFLLSSRTIYGLEEKEFLNYREYTLGLIAEEGGDLEQAAGHFRRSVDLSPRHLESRAHLASVYIRQGNYGQAMEEFDVMERDGGRSPELEVNRAFADLKQRNYGAAIRRLSPLLSRPRESLEPRILLTLALLLNGDIAEGSGSIDAGYARHGMPFLERLVATPSAEELKRIRSHIEGGRGIPDSRRGELLSLFSRYY